MENRNELTALQFRAQVIRIQELIFDFTKEISKLKRDLDDFDQSLNLPSSKLRDNSTF